MPLVNGIFRENLSGGDFFPAAYAQETTRVFLHLLDVSILNPGDTTYTTYRYVDDYTPVTFNDGSGDIIYQPATFKLTLGNDDADSTPQVTLNFDSGDRTVIRRLRETDARPKVAVSVVISPYNTTGTITRREIGPISLEANEFGFKSTQVTVNLVVEPILGEPCPSSVMNPRDAPALWSGVPI